MQLGQCWARCGVNYGHTENVLCGPLACKENIVSTVIAVYSLLLLKE